MNASKVLWLDVETTGLYPSKHAIVQLAYIVEIDGEEVHREVLYAAPDANQEITDKALEITGFTQKEILEWPSQKDLYNRFKKVINRYVDPFDKSDKMFIGGYNVSFDVDFLRALFKRHGDNYFGSYFWFATLDPARVAAFLLWTGLIATSEAQDFKLGTLCTIFGVELNEAHDAMADVEATRQVAYRMQGTAAPAAAYQARAAGAGRRQGAWDAGTAPKAPSKPKKGK